MERENRGGSEEEEGRKGWKSGSSEKTRVGELLMFIIVGGGAFYRPYLGTIIFQLSLIVPTFLSFLPLALLFSLSLFFVSIDAKTNTVLCVGFSVAFVYWFVKRVVITGNKINLVLNLEGQQVKFSQDIFKTKPPM